MINYMDFVGKPPNWAPFLGLAFKVSMVELLKLYRKAAVSFFKMNHHASTDRQFCNFVRKLNYRIEIVEDWVLSGGEFIIPTPPEDVYTSSC